MLLFWWWWSDWSFEHLKSSSSHPTGIFIISRCTMVCHTGTHLHRLLWNTGHWTKLLLCVFYATVEMNRSEYSSKPLPLQQFAVQCQRQADVNDGKIVDGKTAQHSNQRIHVVRLKRLTTKHKTTIITAISISHWNLYNTLFIFMAIFPSGPRIASTRMSPLWILSQLRMMEVGLSTGAIGCAKLQSNRQH